MVGLQVAGADDKIVPSAQTMQENALAWQILISLALSIKLQNYYDFSGINQRSSLNVNRIIVNLPK